jgi:hypothetical protein
MTTPPADASRLSDESTVARCADGISPFRKACRTGPMAENRIPQTATSASTTPNFATRPVSAMTTTVATVAASSTDVRRRNARETTGASTPPAISVPAMSAAESPAIAYEPPSPYSSSR